MNPDRTGKIQKLGRLRWVLRVAVLGTGVGIGCTIGLGLYTFYYAKGASYLTNDSKACNNCHIMNEQYDGWLKGSHRAVANCNDCHAPHSFIGKYLTKASNGFWHSYAFTTGFFHEPIRISDRNRRITEATCRHCHAEIVHAIDFSLDSQKPISCVQCHQGVGHAH